VHAFLQRYGLVGKIRVNLEANHALLASTAFLHEIRYAFANDLFGSLDANRGDPLVGWDTDQFPTNLYQTTLVMHELLVHGGFTKGGLNFDAKLRRQSVDPVDLFHAHVGAMDCYARGLEIAAQMVEDEVLERAVHHRYRGWENELGTAIREGRTDLESLQRRALELGEPQLESGRQEMLENLLNHYVFGDASTSDARRSSSLARERLAEEVGRSR